MRYVFNVFTGTFDLVDDGGGGGSTPTGPAGGDLYGTYPNPFVGSLNGGITTLGPFADFVSLDPNVTTMNGGPGPQPTEGLNIWGGDGSRVITMDTTAGSLALFPLVIGSGAIWDVVGPNGILANFGIDMAPTIQSEVGGNQDLTGFLSLFHYEPIFHARGPNVTAGDVADGLVGVLFAPHLLADGGADLSVASLTGGATGILIDSDGTTITRNVGWIHHGVLLDGAFTCTLIDDIAFFAPANGVPASSVYASLFSEASGRQLLHQGLGVFGDVAMETNASVGLQLRSTTSAFLLSRMDTTARDALTAENGMLIYNTDTDTFQGFQAGAWSNLDGGGGGGLGSVYAFGG